MFLFFLPHIHSLDLVEIALVLSLFPSFRSVFQRMAHRRALARLLIDAVVSNQQGTRRTMVLGSYCGASSLSISNSMAPTMTLASSRHLSGLPAPRSPICPRLASQKRHFHRSTACAAGGKWSAREDCELFLFFLPPKNLRRATVSPKKKKPSKKTFTVKSKMLYQCSSCEATAPQKKGKCPDCGEWGTMEAVVVRSESSSGLGGSSGGGGGGGAGAAAAAAAVSSPSSYQPGSSPVPAAARSLRSAWVSPTSVSPRSLADLNKEREAGGGGGGGAAGGDYWRLRLPGPDGAEVGRVLGGGGAVPGSLTLVGGDPGVGKSTLLLQVAAMLSGDTGGDSGGGGSGGKASDEGGDRQQQAPPPPPSSSQRRPSYTRPVLYVSAEESVDQVANRAARLGLGAAPNVLLLAATRVEEILQHIVALDPVAVVVDSIQTVYLDGAPGSAGSVTQVRECAAALLRVAKDVGGGTRRRKAVKKAPSRRRRMAEESNLSEFDDDEFDEFDDEDEEDLMTSSSTSGPAIFLVGHVTKSGDVAGPRVLEHIVDAVLYLEGERGGELRLLRAVKNRFGPADEVGVFRMGELGLSALPDPSAALAAEREAAPSVASVATVAVEGTRPMLLEVQALVSPSASAASGPGGAPPVRAPGGVRRDRLALILAVLSKHAGLRLGRSDVHANVVGGLELREPAADVAVAAALAASAADSGGGDAGPRTRRDVVAFGEVGLGGELRRVPHIGPRLAEAAKLGFRAAVIPASQEVNPRALQALREIARAGKKKEKKKEGEEEGEEGKEAKSTKPMEIIRCKTVVEALGVLIEWPGAGAVKGGGWRRGVASTRKAKRAQEEDEIESDEAFFA